MTEIFHIAGYTRISVDDELERDNVSIENQKAILSDYVSQHFPGSTLTFFEDRDKSGYTFEQRDGYQTMRKGLMSHRFHILLVKDFSRFSRRNSRGLVELEDLRDAGVRIISIGDGIDFPGNDDWLKIQFQFLINEMPVTDTSKKVRSVIKRRQLDGNWLCAAPYGYIINKRKEFEIVPTEADIVRRIFALYNHEGWGYKRIANYLTEEGIPTPRLSEQLRKEAEGLETKRRAKAVWAIVTVQGILDNDFYIGTLRQGKYTRARINGKDIKRDAREQIVIENHHPSIIDARTFATTLSLREKRSTAHYRGVRKNDNIYAGYLTCGDCGSPMFAMSRADLPPAYTCGTYHRRGRKGCTSHHIRVDRLDALLKLCLRRLQTHSAYMLDQLNADLAAEEDDTAETEQSSDHLAAVLENLQEELKITKRQRIRDILKKPDKEALLDETYDALEGELERKIAGVSHQLELLSHKRSTILQVNRVARTAMDIFSELQKKEHLDRQDLELLIDHIKVYEDHLEVQLQADIDQLLETEDMASPPDPEGLEDSVLVQSARNRKDKVFGVTIAHGNHVISEGDPLEIFTDREGEVIFKKYSPMGELAQFAAQYAETLYKTCGLACVICDRDAVIACAGIPRKEYTDRKLTAEVEAIMENRQLYTCDGKEPMPIVDGAVGVVSCLMPIASEGDITGCVASIFAKEGQTHTGTTDLETKLIQTAAGFLGRQLES